MSTSKVVVTNISKDLQETHLKELFSCCGEITDIRLATEDNGERRCVVTYADPNNATAAAALDGTPLGDLKLNVKLEGQASLSTPGLGMAAAGGVAGAAQMMAGLQGVTANPQAMQAIMDANQKRQDEVNRTVYVGNVAPTVTREQLHKFFSTCGGVEYVKVAGDASNPVRYAFVEFKTLEAAQKAYSLNGQPLADRVIKIGRANSPIIKEKAAQQQASTPTTYPQDKLREALKKLAEHKAKIDKKFVSAPAAKKDRSRSRSKSRERGRRRDRSRRSRSRSRSRGRRDRGRRDRRSRSRSRDRGRRGSGRRSRSPPQRNYGYKGLGGMKKKKIKDGSDKEGLFWDGFQWQPKPGAPPAAAATIGNEAAMLLAQAQMQAMGGNMGMGSM